MNCLYFFMNKYVKRYQRIVKGLVKKGFPEFEKEDIKVVETPKISLFWSFAQRKRKGYYIFINKRRRKAKTNSLRGQFAHELSHIVLDHSKKSPLGDLFHNLRKSFSYLFNTGFSRDIETKVDKEAIKRGYAKDLLSIEKEVRRLYSRKIIAGAYSRGYLSPDETEEYAKKIGKWR